MAPTNILRGDNAKPKSAGPKPTGPKRTLKEPRIVIIRAGKAVIRARLRDTATAERLWTQLPIYSTAEIWGAAVHFETHTETGREPTARQNVKAGEIGYWVEDDRVIIGFGMTPISKTGEIRMPSPVNIWADALDDVAALAVVRPGERVALLQADS